MELWRNKQVVASHWTSLENGLVECNLCPRNCKINNGKVGFCKVRKNIDGTLIATNYGRSIAMTEEVIETEAVNHYMPGARILSVGNIGCMFSCDFCQNWETSQIQHLDEKVVKTFTPQEVVDAAIKNGIKILSWTYNDPVVWHEFVMDTAKLAKENGLLNLYKSAFYINEEPVKELMEVIDIFSISFKSTDASFYEKYCGGSMQPVLDRVKQVFDAGQYLELSQLLITDRNIDRPDIEKSVDWIVENLSKDVPLHFVAFHPAFKYLDTDRTPDSALFMAKDVAVSKGIRNCYLGNIYQPGISDTNCDSCGVVLIKRFGLSSTIENLAHDGKCTKCGKQSPILYPGKALEKSDQLRDDWDIVKTREFEWSEEVGCLHIVVTDECAGEFVHLSVTRTGSNSEKENYVLGDKGISRVILSRNTDFESGVSVSWDKNVKLQFMSVLDRAHFPTSEEIVR